MRRGSKGIKTSEIEVEGIPILVTRKKIKTIRLRVNRVTKEVKLSSPVKVSENELIDFVYQKLSWIKKHLSKEPLIPVTEKKEYTDGDLIPFKGNNYTLELRPNSRKIRVCLENENMVLMFRSILTSSRKEKAVQDFYRSYLKEEIPKLIDKWEPIMGVSVNEFGVKKMKTRWGTCNIRDRRIWLNLALAEKSPDLLEYVVVHEMVHLLERLHNKRFKNLMTQFMPNWKELQNQLNGKVD